MKKPPNTSYDILAYTAFRKAQRAKSLAVAIEQLTYGFYCRGRFTSAEGLREILQEQAADNITPLWIASSDAKKAVIAKFGEKGRKKSWNKYEKNQ